MNKEEKEKYNKKIKLYKKLGAEKFQTVVFKVEELKFKAIKTICPNFLKHYDKYLNYRKKKMLKKAKTEEERKKIIVNCQFAKMAMHKEFYQEKNRNYHMDLNKPTEMMKYLEWNKSVHIKGLKWNGIIIPISIIGIITGIPGAIPLLIVELLSAGINFECVNIQNYNICRYKRLPNLKQREQRMVEKKINDYGEAAKVIHKTITENEDVPTMDEIINNISNKEQLEQLKMLILNAQKERAQENITKVK